MELQKLRYFYTVAKTEHMTKAAEIIRIAQPALSQSIKSLENELGVPLFEKRGRNIVLTEYGKYLQERLSTVLPEIDALQEGIDRMKSRVNKTVKLNILAASSLIINAIVDYRKKHPDVIFNFEQSNKVLDCDIFITTNEPMQKRKKAPVAQYIKEEKILLAVPATSAWASRAAVELAEVQNEDFIMLSDARPFGNLCNRLCSMAGFYPNILFESDSIIALQNMIGSGGGITFWPEYSWGRVKNKNVVLIPISSPICKRELVLEWHERVSQSPYVEDFYKFLAQKIKSLVR